MTARSLVGLGVALGWWAILAPAAEIVWRPVNSTATVEASPAPGAFAQPAVTLGEPVSLGTARPRSQPASAPCDPSALPIVYIPAVAAAAGYVARAQAPEPPPPAPPPGVAPGPPAIPPPVPPPSTAPLPPADLYSNGPVPPPPAQGPGFWDKCKDIFNFQSGPFSGSGGRCALQSDHCFNGFISPVTNPFLFEDPRALTEIRPIFMYQTIPNKNPVFQGGNIEFFGVQGRVALTNRLSIVLDKLGGIWGDSNTLGKHNGLSEISIGPKYTFLRNEQSGTLGAVGAIFELPVGASDVFQNTGSLSIVPYLTMAQNFWRTCYGSMNVMGEIGYAFATDNKRSDSFFSSLHVDYDVGNLHHFYPFLELNWWNYTHNGGVMPFNFEGADLFNFGSTNVSGHNFVTLAPGLRYKFNESMQIGTALEFPIVGTKDMESFRFTIDFIFRY